MEKYLFILLGICLSGMALKAQNVDSVKHKKIVNNGRFYGSWGYNTEWYTKSNISVNQPQLNNNFTYEGLSAHDRIGWNNLFNVAPTIPQYNYRIGYFFDEKQLWGVEISFDHTKYVVTQGGNSPINGTFHGRQIDSTININNNSLYWQLNNGANWFDIDITRKLPIYSSHNNKIVLYGLVKFGIGPNVPHVSDEIFGNWNIPHFQLGGWNTAVEGEIRCTFFQCVFIEYSNHFVYADYFGLKVYGGNGNNGTAAQNFGAYEMIANLGFTFHIHKTAGTNTAR